MRKSDNDGPSLVPVFKSLVGESKRGNDGEEARQDACIRNGRKYVGG